MKQDAPPPGGGAEWLPSPVKFSAVLVPWVDIAVTKFLVDLVGNGVFVIRNLENQPEKPTSPHISSFSQAWFLVFSCSGC